MAIKPKLRTRAASFELFTRCKRTRDFKAQVKGTRRYSQAWRQKAILQSTSTVHARTIEMKRCPKSVPLAALSDTVAPLVSEMNLGTPRSKAISYQ